MPAAARVSAAAFNIDLSLPAARERWLGRVAHALETDPDGCWVAEDGGRVIGVAEAIVREGLWVLSLLAVDPGGQGTGAGRVLMERALAYAPDRDGGLIVSSNDPRALRLYARAGFALRPTFQAAGALDRRRLPPVRVPITEGGEGDLEALAAVTREVRGAAYAPELAYALRRGSRLLRAGDRGFAIAHAGQGVWLLIASDDEAASALLWSALEYTGRDGEEVRVRWIDGAQQWAIDVVLAAGLRLEAYGALCVQGRTGRLRPFIPSAPFA